MNITEINNAKIVAFKEAIKEIDRESQRAQKYADDRWSSSEETMCYNEQVKAYNESIYILNNLIKSCQAEIEAYEYEMTVEELTA
jgi:hypothetical protein